MLPLPTMRAHPSRRSVNVASKRAFGATHEAVTTDFESFGFFILFVC